MVRVTVVIPVTRIDYLNICLNSLYKQSYKNFEIILINDMKLGIKKKGNLKLLLIKNINPAHRRNVAVKKAKGNIIAFMDDDACADTNWLKNAANFMDKNRDFDVVGGPDLIPENSTFGEKISDILLSNRFLGSGVLAHSNFSKQKEIMDGNSLTLCNLFVWKEAFEKVRGFNEKIGYGGEDTEFMYALTKKIKSRLMYLPNVVVYHKKRSFPFPYLKQRFNFRVNNGKMLFVYPEIYLKNYKFMLFFIAATLFFILLFLKPLIAFYALIIYFLILILISLPYVIKDWRFIILPVAFSMQHAAYYAGIIVGLSKIPNYSGLRKIRRV